MALNAAEATAVSVESSYWATVLSWFNIATTTAGIYRSMGGASGQNKATKTLSDKELLYFRGLVHHLQPRIPPFGGIRRNTKKMSILSRRARVGLFLTAVAALAAVYGLFALKMHNSHEDKVQCSYGSCERRSKDEVREAVGGCADNRQAIHGRGSEIPMVRTRFPDDATVH